MSIEDQRSFSPSDEWPDLSEEFYSQLRGLAAALVRKERRTITLDATGLVHEAVLRIRGVDREKANFSDRYLYGAAVQAMRRILIEKARRRLKRQPGMRQVSISLAESLESDCDDEGEQILQLQEALQDLETLHPERSEIVNLRFFGGLTMPQIASITGQSLATVERRWTIARAWLYQRIHAKTNEE
ncbi:MAG: sigma-70 family RNA polymerase sigma factor [Planctomyces sp.]|nr:sigma-70 family RNA polymerase sigma factor [Planctomyces sp.]